MAHGIYTGTALADQRIGPRDLRIECTSCGELVPGDAVFPSGVCARCRVEGDATAEREWDAAEAALWHQGSPL